MVQTPVVHRAAASFIAGSRRAALPTGPVASALSRRYAGAFSKRAVERETRKMMKRGPKEPPMSQGMTEAAKAMFKDGGSPLFPGTLVAVPLSRYPKSPLDFLRYQFYRTLAFFGGKLTVWGNRLDSMPGWTSAPRYKPNTRQIATTAKTLYREVLEAFAAGDVDALQRLCVPAYASRMIGAVSRRDPQQEVLFEVVKYHQPWRFPQLKSHQIRAANEIDQDQLTEQAVVAISSTQKLSRRDRATGQIITGSTKLQEKVEYVVLARNVDKKTWVMDPWKVWGTTSDTPLEKYLSDREETEATQDKYLKFKTPDAKR